MYKLYRILALALIISSGLMSACNRHLVTVKPVVLNDSTSTTVNNTNSIQDIPGTPDSSYITLQLKCDSIGNVYISKITQLQGDILKQSVQLRDNELKLNAKSQVRVKKEIIRKDSIITVSTEKPVPYPVETITNRLTSWQSFQIWTGRIVLIGLAIFLIIKFGWSKLSLITKLFK